MSAKDTNINDIQFQKLLHNSNYYSQIFKKTEKIISVVFYILNNVDIDKRSETHIGNIASKAHFAHELSLRTLEVKPVSGSETLEQFAQSLITLESTLRIATASHVVTQEVLAVLVNEIDTVLRGLNTFIDSRKLDTDSLLLSSIEAPFRQRTQERPTTPRVSSAPSQQSTKNESVQSISHPDRRERIKTILEAKGEATIKDISDIITDCSEKTIQRELNAMIKDNLIKRQGERRWSRYSIF